MAAKRSRIETALKKAQSMLSNYIPGRKRAEATIDEVLWVLSQARGVLSARDRRKAAAKGGRKAAARRTRGKAKTARRKKAARRKTAARRSAR
jgi:hypothetical protein